MARIQALPNHLSSRFYPDDYFTRINWLEVFNNKNPIELELGAGDGSFLIRYAKAHTGINLLGIERLLGRMRKIDRDTHKAGVENIRLLRIEASYFMRYLPVDNSVQAVHLYFPDPWPKKRHHKHRLVNASFRQQTMRILQPSGMVYLRTDHEDYHNQMLEVFDEEPLFVPAETPQPLMDIKTDFESEFNQKGIPTRHAAYLLQA
ncbi:MAG: tRNA (guanosine(46)-N7)-methyltransferase TrmB [Verrucomicrobiota bacterium]|nr:tRNA (guanosine(46)-N7)-methyltransferase TrmB [Verrucomicrobiota bacterium]